MPDRTTRLCSLPHCDRKHKGHGLCSTHLRRQRAGIPLDRPLPMPAKGRTCTVDNCERPVTAKGMCSLHWQRAQNGVPLGKLIPKPTGGPCEIEGCGKQARYRGWCPMHYQRWITHGDPHKVIANVRQHLTCTVEGCENPTNTRDLCMNHRRRQLRGVPLDTPVRVFGVRQPCAGVSCDKEASAFGLCRRCRERQQYKQNPEPWKARTARRRARSAELTADERELSDAYRYAIRVDPCAYCADADAGHVDHIYPLAKGGTDHWWNLTRACARCNLRKHAHCGVWWHLMRGTWDVSARQLPPVTEADPEHRGEPGPPDLVLVRGCEVGQNYSLFDCVSDHSGRGA